MFVRKNLPSCPSFILDVLHCEVLKDSDIPVANCGFVSEANLQTFSPKP
jgi:hypothetical protein